MRSASGVEDAVGLYGKMLVGMIMESTNATQARLRWDRVRERLDNMKALIGVRSAQDARWKLMRLIEEEREKIMLLDVRLEVDVILNELRQDLFRDDARKKRPLEELIH